MSEQPLNDPQEVWTKGWRIRWAMSYADVSRDELAAEVGYAANTVSNWMHDKGPVRDGVLKQIALRCRVNSTWLKTGQGSPFAGDADGGHSDAGVTEEYDGGNDDVMTVAA